MNAKNKRRWLPWVRDGLIALVIVVAFQWWQARDAATGAAPDLSGLLLDGQPVNLQDYRGKPVLVHFWATWCPICRAEDGNIQNLSEDYPVLTIAMQSGDADEVNAYLKEQGVNFPVLLDPEGILSKQWGVSGVPSSFVIDANGEIRSVTIGYTTEIGLRLRLLLAKS